jgi:hypothetical protein
VCLSKECADLLAYEVNLGYTRFIFLYYFPKMYVVCCRPKCVLWSNWFRNRYVKLRTFYKIFIDRFDEMDRHRGNIIMLTTKSAIG